MTGSNRVAWREGQFLRPQHFQQADRSLDGRISRRANGLRPYAWGLSEIRIDEDLALLGKFTLVSAKGVLPDGTQFAIPDDQPPPPPLDVPADTRDATVYLTLPVAQAGAQEFAEADSASPDIRYIVEEVDVVDCFSAERAREPVELARPHLAFGVTRDQTYGRVLCGLAHIREVQGSRVLFDDRYIPPALDIAASHALKHGLEDILGRCEQRANELAMRAVEATDGGSDTFGSFLLLQSLNRWIPVLRHLDSLPLVHPERLYEELASLAGEIATMIRSDRKAPLLPPYQHENLRGTFGPLIDLLQSMLAAVFDRSAVQLPLDQAGAGAWVSPITDRNLYQHGYFFLAVRAAASAEEVRQVFPSVSKLGAVERMTQIVDSALPGVPLRHTPTPPPQLRVLPGFVYFELDRGSPDWRDFAKSTALGLHVAGDWPDLRLELWCVKGTGR
ncbi:type VI secretion system baseplate subunit TssK [Novosphingobium album (ex Liu et al. 2023)]|uniref:Type VI secretion system baseplate subunit TssK n=1 Tax=Novosphingobium album (ex Liu et al. 2023) TaxID=3031130 RepID=A0ABT5WUY6_9SPHN|nr:type VI secretion system baseplate subunit TssK [Novosphingobium album (ex Liu et al. 2023)]MDE8653715.1 type VI secretion system baseplate subunit TssK [Novosphingobium album (ex Liu et al. 2023)]